MPRGDAAATAGATRRSAHRACAEQRCSPEIGAGRPRSRSSPTAPRSTAPAPADPPASRRESGSNSSASRFGPTLRRSRPAPPTLVYQPRPLQVMLATRALGAVLVISDQVAQRRPRPPEIERIALVRHRVKQDATRPQLPQMRLDRPDRVLAMLKEMIGDDEIDGLRLDRRQQLTIIDHIHRREIPALELRIMRPQLRHRHPIDISRPHTRRQDHRQMQSPDLNPTTSQKLSCELLTRIPHRRPWLGSLIIQPSHRRHAHHLPCRHLTPHHQRLDGADAPRSRRRIERRVL